MFSISRHSSGELSTWLTICLMICGLQLQACTLVDETKPTTELQQLQYNASNGDIDSQLLLAKRFAEGNGLAQDKDQALEWYKAASDSGSVVGSYHSAKIMLEMRTPTTDDARSLLRRSAAAGYAPAQTLLADEYAQSDVSDKRVSPLYLAAASQGLADAQYKLGNLLANGLGMARDVGVARQWYERAAEQGDARAQLALGDMHMLGESVAPDPGAAYEWYRLSAIQGETQAQSNLGDLLTYERYTAGVHDHTNGAKWYQMAAEKGHAHAQARMGFLYENGLGVIRDASQALDWYKRSADQGHAVAQCHLGSLYLRGLGVAPNTNEAKRWFDLAAAQIPSGAIPLLGFIYYDCTQFDPGEVYL